MENVKVQFTALSSKPDVCITRNGRAAPNVLLTVQAHSRLGGSMRHTEKELKVRCQQNCCSDVRKLTRRVSCKRL